MERKGKFSKQRERKSSHNFRKIGENGGILGKEGEGKARPEGETRKAKKMRKS